MYLCKESGEIVYENLEELLHADIISASEYDGYYYILVKRNYAYSNCIWKVDKKTGKASYMMYTEYILTVMDKAKEINPATLRKGA